MMNMRINCIFSFLFCSIFIHAQKPTSTYQRELLGITDLWHEVDLPVSAFAKASPYLNDLRIKGITTDNDTLFAPYIIQTTDEETVIETVDFKTINESRVGNTYFYTFKIAPQETINHINLNLANRNFNWTVKLEGKSDNDNWFTILDKYSIINLDNDYTSYNFTKLIFPNSQYSSYRIAITANEQPELNKAVLQLHTKKEGVFNNYSIKSIKTQTHKEDQQTALFVTLDHPAPVSNISFNIKNKTNYYRAFRIQYVTDSTKTEKGWIRNYGNLLNGTLSSREPAVFNLPSNYMQQLRIIIENEDNQPLDISIKEIKGYTVSLLTRLDNPATYYLTYGDHSLKTPNYDINQFKEHIPANLKKLALGKEQAIVTALKKETSPVISNIIWLWVLLGLIMLLIGWFTYKMMRKKPLSHNHFE